MNEETLKLIIAAQNTAYTALKQAQEQVDAVNTSAKGFGGTGGKIVSAAFSGVKVAAAAAATGIGLLGAGIAASVKEAADAEYVQGQLNAVIKSTGGTAGVTAEMANELAAKYQHLTTFSDEAILTGENMLLTFTNIGKDVFPQATEATLNLAEKFGSVESASTQIGKALNDPINGITALTRVGVTFSDEQKKMIETMQNAGDTAGAQKLILDELEKEYGGLATAARDTFGGALKGLKNDISNVMEEIGNVFLPGLTAVSNGFSEIVFAIQEDFPNIKQQVVDFFTKFEEQTHIIDDVKTKFTEIFDALKGLFDELKNTADANKESMAELVDDGVNYFLDALKKLIDVVTSAVKFYNEHEDAINAVAVAVAGIVVAMEAWDTALEIKSAIKSLNVEILAQNVALAALALAIMAVAYQYGELQSDLDDLSETNENGAKQLEILEQKIKDAATPEDRKKFEKMRDELVAQQTETQNLIDKYSGWKGALRSVGDTFDSVGQKLADGVQYIVDSNMESINAVIDFFGSAFDSVTDWLADVIIGIDNFKTNLKVSFDALITSAQEWGQHMIDNFVQGIKNSVNNLGESLGNVAELIKEKIGFSTNPNIPTEVWGHHMMDNFAGGIDEGNKDVVAALEDTVESVQDRITAFVDGFATLFDKTKDAWATFLDAASDAKKTYTETINDIKGKNKELKDSFASDFANTVLDIKENIASLQGEFADTGKSYDEQIAGTILDAQADLETAQNDLAAELSKSSEEQSAETIALLQLEIAQKEEFLTKHADKIIALDAVISEEKRKRGLDDIELLMEQKETETGIIQQQIDSENAILDAHKEEIQLYHDDIKEQRRLRGLDELALLQFEFEEEKKALRKQEEEALEIKKDAMKAARKALRNTMENIAEDTAELVSQMNKEFAKIPDSISTAMDKVANRLSNAGAMFAGTGAGAGNTTNNNQKSLSIVMNSSGDDSDTLSRLEALLKIL